MLTRFAAAVAFAAGVLLLILAVAFAALNVYYRPTIEYAYTGGAGGTLPGWVTAEFDHRDGDRSAHRIRMRVFVRREALPPAIAQRMMRPLSVAREHATQRI